MKNKIEDAAFEEMERKARETRSDRMLTVEVLIDYLKKQNPKACILGFEVNSNAWIEQFREIPNVSIRTVAEEKKSDLEDLEHWYRGCEDKDEKIKEHMKEVYRYSNDDDIIIRF